MTAPPRVFLYLRPGLYLRWIPDKGRGVFCHDDLKAGEVLEVAPVLLLDAAESELCGTTRVNDYVFAMEGYSDARLAQEKIDDRAKSGIFASGIISYCNHSARANAGEAFIEDSDAPYIRLYALADIKKGDEICIDYGFGWLTNHRLWRYRLAQQEKKRRTAEKD